MTTTEIIRIFNRIARTYPQDGCKSINGFGTVHDGSIFKNTSNAGKVYSDYERGFFWSRDWEAAGADPNKLCLEYPALGIEMKTSPIPNLNHDRVCDDIILYMCGKFDCPDCPDCSGCNRSKDQVKEDMKEMLYFVLKEFMTYALYTCEEEVDGETMYYDMWLSSGEVQCLRDNGTTCKKQGKSIKGMFKSFDMKLEEWMEEGYIIGYVVDFTLCGCKKPKPDFNYKNENIKLLGVTECESC